MIIQRRALLLACTLGALSGLGLFTFDYAEGTSYFSTNPSACANCHIMNEQYDSWQKAGHHQAATCVDCHLPHDFVPKYLAKADHGYRHSKAFTLQNFHEPIQITARDKVIVQENCVRCHSDFVHELWKDRACPAAKRCSARIVIAARGTARGTKGSS